MRAGRDHLLAPTSELNSTTADIGNKSRGGVLSMNEAITANPMIDRIISTVGELPASPAIVSSVMGLTSNLDTDVEKLGRVLSSDQAVTAKVLKLSNSSFYGRSKGVGTLKEAIMILGFYTLRSLVVASSTHSLYKKRGEGQPEQKLWEHSLATAMACKMVGRKLRHSQTEESFIAGLLHDLGKLILFQKLPEVYDNVLSEVVAKTTSFVEIETESLGFSHADVAQVLFTRWNFPSFLTEAICGHHNPETEEFDPAKTGIDQIPIAYVVHFCNQLAKHVGCGFEDRRVEDLTTLPLARFAGLERDEIDELIEDLKEVYQSEKHLFDE